MHDAIVGAGKAIRGLFGFAASDGLSEACRFRREAPPSASHSGDEIDPWWAELSSVFIFIFAMAQRQGA